MAEEKCVYHIDHESRIRALEKNDREQNKKLDYISGRINQIFGSIIVLLLGVLANIILLVSFADFKKVFGG